MKHLSNIRENELFDWLKLNYFPDLTPSRKKFSKWDCYCPKYKARIELKCRRTHYDTLFIEKAKYEALIAKCKPHNDKPLYINSTPEGIYVFELNNIPEPKWFEKMLPKTTEFNKRHFVKKEVGELRLDQAKKIDK